MKVRRISGRGLSQTFSVVVPADQFDSVKDQQLGELAASTDLDGFRKGKAPMALVRHRFGSDVENDLARQFLQSALSQVLAERQLQPLEVVPEIPPNRPPGEPFTCQFTVHGVKPVKKIRYGGWKLDVPVVDITSEDIDQRVEELRRSVAESREPEPEHRAGPGDQLLVRMEDHTHQRKPRPIPFAGGFTPAEFRDLWGEAADLTGMRAREDRTFRVKPQPGNGHDRVRVLKVFAVKILSCEPASEEEVISALGQETAADMRSLLRASMKAFVKEVCGRLQMTRVVEKLVRSNRIRLPGPLMERLAKGLEGSHWFPDITGERTGPVAELARLNIAAPILLMAIVREQKLEPDNEDLIHAAARDRDLSRPEVRREMEEQLKDSREVTRLTRQVSMERAAWHLVHETQWRETRMTYAAIRRWNRTMWVPRLLAPRPERDDAARLRHGEGR